MRTQSGNTCRPAASSRKVALRYCAPPRIADTKWPMKPRATSGAKMTGALPVGRRRAPSRATVRSPAVRPIAAAAARSRGSRAVSYQ